ncbi:MAG: hypothetical protein Kow0079_06690 [Vicingaceae bacterium]
MFAQLGTPLISNYALDESGNDNQTWSVVQDDEELMLFASRKGVLTFDGLNWSIIKTPSVPQVLYKEKYSGSIFVGCVNEFGVLNKNINGLYEYKSIVKNKTIIGNIEKIISNDQYIYFYSNKCLTRIKLDDFKKIKQWPARNGEPYTGFILNYSTPYLNINKLGLHQVTESLLKPLPEGTFTDTFNIVFSLPYSNDISLIALNNNKLYLFNGQSFIPYTLESQEYVDESIISNGIDLPTLKMFAISTTTGGCLVVNKNSGKTEHTINYQTGLPDDEVYAMGLDMNYGLWILHEFGMSRVDLQVPIFNFNQYPGLEGNIITLTKKNNFLYVATSEGVYYLDKVKNYEEIEVLIKKPVDKNNPNVVNAHLLINNKKTENPTEDKTAEKKKLFNLNPFKKNSKEEKKTKRKDKKRKKKEKDTSQNEIEANNEESINQSDSIETNDNILEKTEIIPIQSKNKTDKSYQIVTKKIYALQSISHKFYKLKGIDSKAKQLIHFNDRILVATNTGLFEIINNKVFAIKTNTYINFIAPSKSNNSIFYIGTSSGIFIIQFENNKWNIIENFNDFNENVYSILEHNQNQLWVGCDNVAYLILLDKNYNPVDIKPYTFNSNFGERVLVREVFNIPYFFLSSGIYSYDALNDKIVFNENVNKNFSDQSKYIFTQNGITWFYNGEKWTYLYENSKLKNLPERFLELFYDVSNIYVDEHNNLWVIDQNKYLYQVKKSNISNYNELFNVYFRNIINADGAPLPLSDLHLDFDNNSLKFSISAPYYLKSNATKYQYWVEGLMKNWSDWSESHIIDFPFIPPGKYTIHIRAKNILGHVTNVKTFEFKVKQPYWKSWWFIGLISIAIALIIWFIIKQREQALKNRQKYLEEKVYLRTKQLHEQKKVAEDLLLNILPEETANELKTTGKASTKYYENASVLFTDIEGFTKLSQKLTPTELVQEIDKFYSKFDEIIEKYGVEKIKTIGDAYMAVCGLPKERKYNAALITLAALDFCDYMNKHKTIKKIDGEDINFNIRIGIHTGPLVAGVVGKKKFAYDVWGDTVNTASRMESSGKVGRVNVSEDTYQQIKDFFECKYRGKIEAKHKGKIAMYFVNRIKPEYALDEDGIFANEKLLKILEIK